MFQFRVITAAPMLHRTCVYVCAHVFVRVDTRVSEIEVFKFRVITLFNNRCFLFFFTDVAPHLYACENEYAFARERGISNSLGH